MPFLLLDLLALILILAAALTAGALVRRYYLRDPKVKVLTESAKRRETGETNVVKLEAREDQRCVLCGKATDAAVDLYVRPPYAQASNWVHEDCYRSN